MKGKVLAAVSALALAAIPQMAGASSDFGCTPSWNLGVSSYQCAGSALIGPRNDTRTNLFWLLRDRAGTTAPGPLVYPAYDWESAGYGHVFLSWDTVQAIFWPRPGGEEEGVSDAAYSGSRCQTVDSGAAAFRAALSAARGLAAGEGEVLSQARELVKPVCDGDRATAAWPEGLRSKAGQAFLAYLQGARAFYAEDFATARARFGGLSKAPDAWLAETARYMVARTELAAAQADAIDEWGGFQPDKADRAAAARGKAALADYLSAYPRGRYAASAQGLQRRAAWLMGDGAALAGQYGKLFAAQSPLDAGTPQLLEETDNKLLFGIGVGERADAPLLLAVWDLVRMRKSDPELAAYVPKPLTAEELAAQAPAFARVPDLYGFLQASHAYHVAGDWRRVLSLIPDDARRTGYTPLAFSRQMLRGLALEKLGDRNAAGFWQELSSGVQDLYQRPAVELALAMNRERAGRLVEVFAPNSAVREPEIRARLLEHVAGVDLLRARAAGKVGLERDVALFTLLYKQLSRGRYDGFGKDLALVPATGGTEGWIGGWNDDGERHVPFALFARGRWQEGYPCPALKQTAATLAARPADVAARLCLAEFYRLNGFDDYLASENKPDAEELGGTAGQFPGKAATRADIYAAVLSDRAAAGEDAAYALYRSVMCYAPSGNNSCGSAQVPSAQRKAWYQRLKAQHPKSKWAIALKYYW